MALFLPALSFVLPYSLSAQSTEPSIRVAARICPPFVMKDSGQYSGISIFLWEKIAEKYGLAFGIEEYGLEEMMDAVAQGKADIAISCLSITQEREEIIDFSHSFFETHLSIAVKQHGFLHTLQKIFKNKRLFVVVGIVFGAAALIGGILFWMERHINTKLYATKTKIGKLMEAVIVGLLFVTSGPIRYYEFKTLGARILAALMAVGSTVMIAGITALLASAFTLDQMHSDITGPKDLAKLRVGVMESSTSFLYLQEQGINSRTFRDRQELLASLDDGRLDAIVGDAAILKYKIREAQKSGKFEKISVLPFVFEKQNYGLALQDDSPYIEKLNQALLSVRDTPEWKAEIAKFIGE
jgi:polar amino acid transport system substrate-binding protein